MSTDLPEDGLGIDIGGMPRDALLAALDAAGVQRNESADRLLADSDFDGAGPEQRVRVVERTVADLGLPDGGPLSGLLEAAAGQGLRLCPPRTGPHLRLALPDQAASPDSVLRAGRAPAASLTVLSPQALGPDDEPKGFYLRVVDGVRWLRGFSCTDEHRWSPGDRLVLALPPSPAPGG